MPKEAYVQPPMPHGCLADYQLPQMARALRCAGNKARVMVASGDVWLDFDPSEIPVVETDIAGIGMRVPPEVAQHLGVHFVSKSAIDSRKASPRTISFFLQKPSPAEIRHFESIYDFYVDTGMWLFSEAATAFLFKRCGWSEPQQRFVTKTGNPLPLDLYTEIGSALGTETKLPAALKKLGLGKLSASVIPLETAHFYHLGSSRQLLESIEEM